MKKHPRDFLPGDIVISYKAIGRENYPVISCDYYMRDEQKYEMKKYWSKTIYTIVGAIKKDASYYFFYTAECRVVQFHTLNCGMYDVIC